MKVLIITLMVLVSFLLIENQVYMIKYKLELNDLEYLKSKVGFMWCAMLLYALSKHKSLKKPNNLNNE